MKKSLTLLTFLILNSSFLIPHSSAQDGMGVGNTDPQEMLDVTGAIRIGETVLSSPVNPGTIRWNSTDEQFEGWDGTQWVVFGSGGSNITATYQAVNLPNFTPPTASAGVFTSVGAALNLPSAGTYRLFYTVYGRSYGYAYLRVRLYDQTNSVVIPSSEGVPAFIQTTEYVTGNCSNECFVTVTGPTSIRFQISNYYSSNAIRMYSDSDRRSRMTYLKIDE